MAKNVLHEPQLDTILMVEKAIKDAKQYNTRAELWKSLPTKIQYQTFLRILQYLEASNKILLDSHKIVWIAVDNTKLRELLSESETLR